MDLPSPLRRRKPLLARAERDPAAFHAFYEAYAEGLLVFIARRTYDAETAFDLMSETFAKALERRAQFRGTTPEEEQAWLFGIARGELSHFWRHGAVEKAALTHLRLSVPELTDADIDRLDELSGIASVRPHLLSALAALPHDQRIAIEWRVVREFSYAEVAARLGVTEVVCRARVSRGLRALAERLQDLEDFEDVA